MNNPQPMLEQDDQDTTDTAINLLVPMFMPCSAHNPALAFRAAEKTVYSYRFHNHGELLLVVQVIAFAMATIKALGLSMAADAPLSTIVRLQSNAVALNKSEHRQRGILRRPPAEQHRGEAPQPRPQVQPEEPEQHQPIPTEIEDAAIITQVEQTQKRVEQANATRPPDQETAARYALAAGFVSIAQDCVQDLPNLPQVERQEKRTRAVKLCLAIQELLKGAPDAAQPDQIPSSPANDARLIKQPMAAASG